jgi:hypothetical protein
VITGGYYGMPAMHSNGPSLLWAFGEPGYDELLYLPDYADEDSIAAFFVLRRDKPQLRLSETEAAHLHDVFPEANLRSFINR